MTDASAIPSHPVYLNQLARARRFFDRTSHRTAPDLAAFTAGLNDSEDDLWAFFMNCWHVKDWVKNDNLLPEALRNQVAAAAETRDTAPMLAVCADVAKGIKHVTLTRRPHAGGAKVETFVITPATDGRSVSWDYLIGLDDGSYATAYEVGREALLEWNRILQAHHLPLLPGWTDP